LLLSSSSSHAQVCSHHFCFWFWVAFVAQRIVDYEWGRLHSVSVYECVCVCVRFSLSLLLCVCVGFVMCILFGVCVWKLCWNNVFFQRNFLVNCLSGNCC
jgi:hypothetical protein